MAKKNLSNDTLYPTLGIDTTLPQYRGIPSDDVVKQDEFPVSYFFYGTLGFADLIRLMKLLELDLLPKVRRAHIKGGTLKQWGGKYKALVDGPLDAEVSGVVYEVESAKHEEALRCYETENYEVVRCTIVLESGERRHGLTFRFADPSLVQ